MVGEQLCPWAAYTDCCRVYGNAGPEFGNQDTAHAHKPVDAQTGILFAADPGKYFGIRQL